MSAVVTQHPRLARLIEREQIRDRIEAAVARLIDALDAIDGDPDAEPWLGASERMAGTWGKGVGANDDREDANEHGGDVLDEGDDDRVDGEPSLGATEALDQTQWGRGGRQDLELDR